MLTEIIWNINVFYQIAEPCSRLFTKGLFKLKLKCQVSKHLSSFNTPKIFISLNCDCCHNNKKTVCFYLLKELTLKQTKISLFKIYIDSSITVVHY